MGALHAHLLPGGPRCGPQDMERARAPAAEGLAFLPSLPPSPCIVLIRPCSSTGVLPVLTREKCGQAGEKPSSVRAPPPVLSKGGRGAPASPSPHHRLGWRVLQTPRASVFSMGKWARDCPSVRLHRDVRVDVTMLCKSQGAVLSEGRSFVVVDSPWNSDDS